MCIHFTFIVGLWAIVNNAGIQRVGDIELISLDQMKRVAEVNLYGQVRMTKASIPMIRKSKGNRYMRDDARKPVFKVSDKVWHKPACTVTDKG